MQTAVIVRCKDELRSCHLLGSIFILDSLVQWRGELFFFFLFFLSPFTWKIMMKPCVVVMAINSATEKALQKSSTSEHLSLWKFFLHLCTSSVRPCVDIHAVLPSKCLGLCKYLLLPNCVLPEGIHSCIWSVNMDYALNRHLILDPQIHGVFSLPFSISLTLHCFIFLCLL